MTWAERCSLRGDLLEWRAGEMAHAMGARRRRCRLSELYVTFRIEKQRSVKRPKVEITG
ncbi:MAG: hypothetical protein ACJ8BW_21040 [Ktedonobacteraceae bacterium]